MMQYPTLPAISFKTVREKAIKQGLANILGESGAMSVIFNFKLNAYENDPIAFHNSLLGVFKETATKLLEKAIIKELFAQMGQSFDSSSSFDFATHMNFAKQLFVARMVQ